VVIDPVFVGPRTQTDKKFFKIQAIKLGIQKALHAPDSRWYRWVDWQTPELCRWAKDVTFAAELFKTSDVKTATDWAVNFGYKSGRFWQTQHLDIDSFDITMPGCKKLSHEKLLFVLKFSGKE
jgi:hypothetical protein